MPLTQLAHARRFPLCRTLLPSQLTHPADALRHAPSPPEPISPSRGTAARLRCPAEETELPSVTPLLRRLRVPLLVTQSAPTSNSRGLSPNRAAKTDLANTRLEYRPKWANGASLTLFPALSMSTVCRTHSSRKVHSTFHPAPSSGGKSAHGTPMDGANGLTETNRMLNRTTPSQSPRKYALPHLPMVCSV